jgi:hypothetical protein
MDGDYLVTIDNHWQKSANTTFTYYLYQNATVIKTGSFLVTTNQNFGFSRVVRCVTGDQIKLQAKASATGGVVYGASSRYSTIDITLVGG